MQPLTKLLKTLLFVLSIVSITAIVFGADGNVDENFIASAIRARGSNVTDLAIEKAVKQPDGKILIAGNFHTVGEHSRYGIARLNIDGSIDTSFNPPEISFFPFDFQNTINPPQLYSIAVQPDGKILIGGYFAYINGVYRYAIARLNADGSPDTAFNANAPVFNGSFGYNYVKTIEILPDGKIMLGGAFCFNVPNSSRCVIGRLNSDGTPDTSFNVPFAETANRYEIKVLADGKILNYGDAGIKRFNSDGSADSTFTITTATDSSTHIDEVVVLPDNKIIIVGSFTRIQNVNTGGIARLFADGTIDSSFNSGQVGANSFVRDIQQTSDGKLVIGGNFTRYNNVLRSKVARINLDGSLDAGFNLSGAADINTGFVNEVLELDNGKIFIGGGGGFWDRMAISDSSGLVSANSTALVGKSGLVNSIVQQPDGKVIAGGRFNVAVGKTRNNLVRFNTDGTVDDSFQPFTTFAESFIVKKIYLLPDGKMLVGLQGERGLVRLNTDGSLDSTFNANLAATSDVRDIEVRADGKILALGKVQVATGGIAHQLARLSSNGAFEFSMAITDGELFVSKLQADGKILVGGSFTRMNDTISSKIARLNADGTTDTTFNPPAGTNGHIRNIDLQANGKVVVVGEFSALGGSSAQKYVGRLNADGTLDTSFSQSANYFLYAVKVQPDGKILIGGAMAMVAGLPVNGIARLNSNGSLDNSFQTGKGTNGAVYDIQLQSDNKVLAAGDFTRYNDISKLSIVRLQNNLTPTVTRTRFDFDGDGRADIGVYRPSSSVWYQLLGANYQFAATSFGIAEDILAPADFDGDGKTDLGIYRPSTATFWYAASSAGGAFRAVQFGQAGDIPLPSDIDGNGKADFVVYRPSNNSWNRLTDGNVYSSIVFGTAGDKPVIGDFDNDGKSDPAIYRPSTGQWWYAASSAGNAFRSTQWGIAEDIPVAADYDGDGKTDLAVYRPSNNVWYILNSGNSSATIIQFGSNGDKPVAADYDGDGKSDIAVYRPSTGEWFIQRTTAGFFGLQFGISQDIPIPNAFVR